VSEKPPKEILLHFDEHGAAHQITKIMTTPAYRTGMAMYRYVLAEYQSLADTPHTLETVNDVCVRCGQQNTVTNLRCEVTGGCHYVPTTPNKRKRKVKP
jgi:hypothetical protein